MDGVTARFEWPGAWRGAAWAAVLYSVLAVAWTWPLVTAMERSRAVGHGGSGPQYCGSSGGRPSTSRPLQRALVGVARLVEPRNLPSRSARTRVLRTSRRAGTAGAAGAPRDRQPDPLLQRLAAADVRAVGARCVPARSRPHRQHACGVPRAASSSASRHTASHSCRTCRCSRRSGCRLRSMRSGGICRRDRASRSPDSRPRRSAESVVRLLPRVFSSLSRAVDGRRNHGPRAVARSCAAAAARRGSGDRRRAHCAFPAAVLPPPAAGIHGVAHSMKFVSIRPTSRAYLDDVSDAVDLGLDTPCVSQARERALSRIRDDRSGGRLRSRLMASAAAPRRSRAAGGRRWRHVLAFIAGLASLAAHRHDARRHSRAAAASGWRASAWNTQDSTVLHPRDTRTGADCPRDRVARISGRQRPLHMRRVETWLALGALAAVVLSFGPTIYSARAAARAPRAVSLLLPLRPGRRRTARAGAAGDDRDPLPLDAGRLRGHGDRIAGARRVGSLRLSGILLLRSKQGRAGAARSADSERGGSFRRRAGCCRFRRRRRLYGSVPTLPSGAVLIELPYGDRRVGTTRDVLLACARAADRQRLQRRDAGRRTR